MGLFVDYVVTVEDIIDRFGIPPSIDIFLQHASDDPATLVHLNYPEQGLHFLLEDLPYFSTPTISPETRVAEAGYSEPESFDEFAAHLAQYPSTQWHPWPGYGSLEDIMPSQ